MRTRSASIPLSPPAGPSGREERFLRLLAHLFDSAACYLGWLFPIWDRPKRQTFADKIMHTIVVPASEPPQPP